VMGSGVMVQWDVAWTGHQAANQSVSRSVSSGSQPISPLTRRRTFSNFWWSTLPVMIQSL
jgi:hypothetical protein